MNCPSCGVKLASISKFCPECGAKLSAAVPHASGITLDDDKNFNTLGEAVQAAKDGSVIKVSPGIYIEPENSPLTEISKKIKITGCTEDISNKAFSELAIIVLDKETSCKLTADAVIEGIVFTSDENINFKTLNDYLSEEPEAFEYEDGYLYHDNDDYLIIDRDDFYSLLLVEVDVDLKNIAVLSSGNCGIIFTADKASLSDSIVAFCSGPNILCSGNTKSEINNCLIVFSKNYGMFIEANSEPVISACNIHQNKEEGFYINHGAKPKISNCKIKTEVYVLNSAEPEFSDCELYGSLSVGINLRREAKCSVRNCDIHDNECGIGVSEGCKAEISGCTIHDNDGCGICLNSGAKVTNCKIYNNYGGMYIDTWEDVDVEVASCEIYGNESSEGGRGIWINDAGGSYRNCDIHDNKIGVQIEGKIESEILDCIIHDNKENGIIIGDLCDDSDRAAKPKISNCKIYNNKAESERYPGAGLVVQGASAPEITFCEIYGHLSYGIWIASTTKGTYEDCYIHDNAGGSIKDNSDGKSKISNCDDDKENHIDLVSVKNIEDLSIEKLTLLENKTHMAKVQYELGWRYDEGEGVDQDSAKAFEWYRKSAEQGFVGAQYSLGVMYENGKGVKKDFFKASEWYCKAAGQGDVDAQYNLGAMYEIGEGVEQDYAKAMEWYTKAAAQGDAGAQEKIEKLRNL